MFTPLTIVPSDVKKGRAKRELDKGDEFSPTLQLHTPKQTDSSNGTDAAKCGLSARDLLANLSTKRISLTDIKFAESDPRNGGGFGDVAIATFARKTRNGQGERLAVKKFRFVLGSDMTEEKFFRLFANELRLLDRLSHPNIIKIIGFVEDMKRHIAWLVFPWEDNGNLREFLRSGTWEIPERVSLVIDVANGLKSLHTRQPPICHGDLKSLNILVNSSHRAVITDFGSARVIVEAQGLRASSPSDPATSANDAAEKENECPEFEVTVSNTAFTLTGPAWSLRWAAPEVLKGSPPNLASDVWALGWIAWEAITDSYPFEEASSDPQVVMKLIEGDLPSIYKHDQLSQIQMLCGRMQNCWKSDPKERPSATECWQSFDLIPNAIPEIKRGEQSTTRSAALLQEIGEMHRFQNRREEASEAFKRGLTIARATGDRAAMAGLLIRLAGNYDAQFKYKEAEPHYDEALAISNSIGAPSGRAHALLGLGHVQRAQSKNNKAESSFIEALAIYISIEDALGQANALRGLGDMQQARSKYIGAESCYARALALFKSVGYDSGRGYALCGLGDAQIVQSKYIEAESSYAQAIPIFQSFGDELSRGNALRGLGQVQLARSKYIEAESTYAKALAICKSIGDDLGRTVALRGLGHAQRARGMLIEAGSFYMKSLAISKNIGYDYGRVNDSLSLAEVRFDQGRYAEAKALLQDATPIAEKLEYAGGIQRSKELLPMVLERERSSLVQSTATLPTSSLAQGSIPPAPLPLPNGSVEPSAHPPSTQAYRMLVVLLILHLLTDPDSN